MSTVIRWNPLREMAAMQTAMNRLFDETWRTAWPTVEANYALPVDVYEMDEGYTVIANIPGVQQDNINITLNQNIVTINVDVPQFTPQEGQRALLVERSAGKYSRSLTLPRSVHSEAVEATYENGVLMLHLPIAPEAQPKRITVKSGGQNVLQSNN